MSPDLRTPEYTLKKARVPTKGSVAIFKANAEKGSSSDDSLLPSVSSLSSNIHLIAGTSNGDGIKSITASNIA